MKKVLSILAILMVATTSWADVATNVKYIDANGVEQTCPEATVIKDGTIDVWENGWYVVQGDESDFYDGVICRGDVHLILTDGCRIQVDAAGDHTLGVLGNSTLHIYGQKNGSGCLCAYGSATLPGIGTHNDSICVDASIIINGGNITAIGGNSAPGIGIGMSGMETSLSITINGGSITATGHDAPAIGRQSESEGIISSVIVNKNLTIWAGDSPDSYSIFKNDGSDLTYSLVQPYVLINPAEDPTTSPDDPTGTPDDPATPSDESEWVSVVTPTQFAVAVKTKDDNGNCTTNIRLKANIDLSSLSAVSSGDQKGYLFGDTFQGKIDGQNHYLKNSTHPLFYRTSGATIENVTLDEFSVTGNQTSLIARTSYASNFNNVRVVNSSIKASENNNFGMIVGYSNCDTISYCTVDGSCSITANRRQIGGIAGEAFNGKISYCYNGATITGDADYIGGIVGLSGDGSVGSASTIEYCLNTGTISGDDECGGIAGQYYKGTITHCVNAGTISSKDGGNHSNMGGIVGKLCSATCESSINFASVAKAKSQNAQFAIYGGKDGTITATDNEYYCDVKGKHFDSGISFGDIMSGKYAYAKDWLYQSVDNGLFTATVYPVPLPEVGKVYSNTLCDGVQIYTNNSKYHSTAAHESELDGNDVCTICGKNILHISDAEGLIAFAEDVNNGYDYRNWIVYLDNDIYIPDTYKYSDLTVIGNSESHRFAGVFDGQGHRVSNIFINSFDGGQGLFGNVAGNNTVIRNVIVSDSYITSAEKNNVKCYGTAAIVGRVTSTSGSRCNVTIENCGNESHVNGDYNGAGILGGVYNNDNTVLTIRNCYNTSVILDGNESGVICGWAGKHYTISNCYNSGEHANSASFYRGETSYAGSVTNCYDVNGTQTGVQKITASELPFGHLCQKLNSNGSVVFAQDLENDSYPVPGSEGLHYTRSMSSQWGTIVLPFDVDISDTGYCTFYQVESVSGSLLTLRQIEGTLAAGTPALVCMVDTTMVDEEGKYQLWLSAENSTVNTNIYNAYPVNGLTLTGTYNLIESLTHIYYIHDNKFWYADDPIGILPFRAYLDGTIEGVDCLSFGKGGIVDGITSAEVDTANDQDIYNLAGQRLNAPKKGQINIIGGRKVFVK